MKKMLTLLAFAAILLLTLNSCTTGYSKDSYIRSLERFVTSVENHCDNFDEQDWDRADRRMAAFREQYSRYEKKFSRNDVKRVAKLMTRYAFLRGKSAVTDFWDELKTSIEWGMGAAQELFQDVSLEMQYWASSFRSAFQ